MNNNNEAQTPFTRETVEMIVNAALHSLLWSEGEIYGEDGEPTLDNWDEIYDFEDATPELRASITAEIVHLLNPVSDDQTAMNYRHAVTVYSEAMGNLEWSWEAQFGHDMALTRNGHGAGFWDRGLGEIGDVLTEWAKHLGTLHVFHGAESIHPEWAGMFHAE